MDAREYFEGVRAAVFSRSRCEQRLEKLRSAEGVKAQGYSGMPTGKGGVSDPMAATDSRMVAEQQAAADMQAYEREIADGFKVCSGVRKAHPSLRWGDALEFRYCLALDWANVASCMNVTRQQAQRDANAAMDWIDAVGIAAAREGCGQQALPLV